MAKKIGSSHRSAGRIKRNKNVTHPTPHETFYAAWASFSNACEWVATDQIPPTHPPSHPLLLYAKHSDCGRLGRPPRPINIDAGDLHQVHHLSLFLFLLPLRVSPFTLTTPSTIDVHGCVCVCVWLVSFFISLFPPILRPPCFLSFERERERELSRTTESIVRSRSNDAGAGVCVCVCVCTHACVCVCVCVCGPASGRVTLAPPPPSLFLSFFISKSPTSVCVCVCVCVCERERKEIIDLCGRRRRRLVGGGGGTA